MLTVEALLRRSHRLAQEAGELARAKWEHDVDRMDVADRKLALGYVGDARRELDRLERRLGVSERRGKFVALQQE